MKLVTVFLPTLMPRAIALAKSKHDAEDMLQDVALKILLKQEDIEKMSEPEQQKYAFVMLRNAFIDRCRKKKEFTCDVPEKAVESDAEIKVELKEVQQAMKGMNQKHVSMLCMAAQGYKSSEIAQEHNVSANTVFSGVRYAKQAINNHFTQKNHVRVRL